MRSFTKKNIPYTGAAAIGGVNYDLGDSMYKLLYTDGTGNNIQNLRNQFALPAFKNAAKALVGLAVQLKKTDWDANNPTQLNITSIIDIGDLKMIFSTLGQNDYIINADAGGVPRDIIAAPQTGKSVDFDVIKNTDRIQLAAIEKLILEKQYFTPEKIRNVLTSAPFNLQQVPPIDPVVIKNMATLLVLRQALYAVKLRSEYENLYGFKYTSGNQDFIRLNHYIYKSANRITQDIVQACDDLKTEANRIAVNGAPRQKEVVVIAIDVYKNLLKALKDYSENNSKTDYLKTLNTLEQGVPSSSVGRANLLKCIEYTRMVLKALKDKKEEKNIKIRNKRVTVADAVKATGAELRNAIKAIKDGKAAKKINVSAITGPAQSLREAVTSAISPDAPINTDKSVDDISKIAGSNRADAIVANPNAAIALALPATTHIRFVPYPEVNWTRQHLQAESASNYIIIPFGEGEQVVDKHINSLSSKTGINTIQEQGELLMRYLSYHYNEGAGRGYRKAKSSMLYNHGLFCAFCESPFTDGRTVDVEHKVPKATFPTQALNWENFVLACKVCNSDFKSQKFVDAAHAIKDRRPYADHDFSTPPPVVKNYLECRKIAEREVLWPDKKHSPVNAHATHELLSFQAISSALPGNIGLNSIELATKASVQTKPLAAGHTYQIDILNLRNGARENDVSVKLEKAGNLPADVNGAGVKTSSANIINICGLDQINKNCANDQRIVSRTKAWLNAMKQLKLLSELRVKNIANLYTYYEAQLHPANIRHNQAAPNHSNIGAIRGAAGAADTPIALHKITGTFRIATTVGKGKVAIDLSGINVTANPGGAGTPVSIADRANSIANNAIVKADGLTGEIKETAGVQTMTGRMGIDADVGTGVKNVLIVFKDAVITGQPGQTTLTIAPNQGIISESVDVLNSWDSSRADLLWFLNQATTVLHDLAWENILDMVCSGGFYSTWLRTFEANRPTSANEVLPVDLQMVHRLDMKAWENPDDPFQFHGTDAEEIIARL